jgi:hypothetical protein
VKIFKWVVTTLHVALTALLILSFVGQNQIIEDQNLLMAELEDSQLTSIELAFDPSGAAMIRINGDNDKVVTFADACPSRKRL